MVKKTYAEQCLERAEKATEVLWKFDRSVARPLSVDIQKPCSCGTDVPELARRLQKAIEFLKRFELDSNDYEVIDALEKPLGD